MKKIYIIIGLTLLLLASPMGEERALALFNSIKQSEYDWVVEKWNAEMHIKTQSRSSTRKSVWERDENSRDIRENIALHNRVDGQDTEVIKTPVLPPNTPQEPITVPDIK